MSEQTCRCGRPTRDNAYVCDTCADGLTKALAEIPWLADELDTTLTGRKGIDYRRLGGAPSSEPRLPLHTAASELLAELRATLVSWVKYCDAEHVRHQSPRHALPADTLQAMSGWLMWRVDGLTFLDIGPEVVREFEALVERGSHMVDRPADRWYVGPCPQCGTGIFAPLGADHATCRQVVRDIAAEVEVCGQTVDVGKRRGELLTEAEDRLLNAAELSRAVSWLGATPLTGDRVRKWAQRGRILAHGHDGRYPLYRVGDAIDLLASDTTKGASA